MSTISVRVNSRIPAVTAAVQAKAGLAVAKAAHDIEAQAVRVVQQKNIIDTGLLMNSIRAEQEGDG